MKVHMLICVAAVAVLIGLAWLVHRTYTGYRTFTTDLHTINRLSTTISRLDEVLTMSAKMAAATGEPRWQQRYQTFQPQLDAAITEAYALAPDAFVQKAIAQTDTANAMLVEMERRAFQLLQEGHHEAARALLRSPEYETQKKLYSNGIQQYITELAEHTTSKMDKSRNMFLTATTFCVFLVVLAMFSGVAAMQFRRQLAIRKHADTHLLRIRAALDDATDAVAVTNENGKIIYANVAFYDLFKCSAEQINADDLNVIFVNRQAFVDMYRSALKLACWKGELELMAGNGRRFPASLRCSPIVDKATRIAGILILVTDITERKQAELTLQLTCRQLEEANSELKTMQAQMVQSEKLASIGQLAAGVAHEMNTPVGFVASNFKTLESYMAKIKELLALYDEVIAEIEASGNARLLEWVAVIRSTRQMLKMDFICNDIQDLFHESEEGLDRITGIVQNLRDFSGIDQPRDLDEYSLADGIRTTLAVVENELQHVADVQTDFSDMPPILCHSGQINQVLLNILINAAQAIKSQQRENRGLIRIKTYRNESYAVCEISDDGPGIDDETRSKIFDPFFTTKPIGSGTGLGLAVAYDIVVKKHGGSLLVDSTVGKGATFTLKLPLFRSRLTTEIGEHNLTETKEHCDGNERSPRTQNGVIC